MVISEDWENFVWVFFTQFIRIRGVIIWSGIAFIGFLLGISSLDISVYVVPFVFFIVMSFCIMSFTFAINNVFDAASDRENPRRMHVNAVASGRISKKSGIIVNVMFVVIPLLLSLVFGWDVFVVSVVLLMWMWVYSSPPVRLKGRAGVDVVWHFFAFLLLVLWGLVVAGSVSVLGGLVAVSMGLWSVIGQIWNHIDDYRFDKESGTVTFAVWAGLDRSKKVMQWSVVVHLVFLLPLMVLFSVNYCLSFCVLVVGLVVAMLVRPRKDFPLSRGYYVPFVFAGFVYLSCVVYHVLMLLGEPVGGWFVLFPFF